MGRQCARLRGGAPHCRMMFARAILALIVVCIRPTHGSAQPHGEPTAAKVADALRTAGHSAGAVNVLTQARGPRPAQLLDDIADTLVAVATSPSSDDLRGAKMRLAAVDALMLAGRGSTLIDDGSGGVRYVGAAPRLMRLAETAPDVGIRAAALSALMALPDSLPYYRFLARVAGSPSAAAYTATHLLIRGGPTGLSVARDLYLANTVTDKSSRWALDGAAHEFGWTRPQ